jgi:hypothetical protein
MIDQERRNSLTGLPCCGGRAEWVYMWESERERAEVRLLTY